MVVSLVSYFLKGMCWFRRPSTSGAKQRS